MADDNQELKQIFIEEVTDLLASISSTLRAWEENLHNLEKIAELKRDLHTLKGSARMVSEMSIGTLAHEIETLCEALAKGQIEIDRNKFELINLGIDRIGLMVENLKNKIPLPPIEDLLQKYTQYLPEGAKKEEVEKAKAEIIKEKISETTPSEASTHKKESQEVIRIRTSLLEKLNNLSSENNVIRVGIEQHTATLGGYISEMRQEARRLETQINTLNSDIQSFSAEELSQVRSIKNGKDIEHEIYDEYSTLEQSSQVIRETAFDLINILKNLTETHNRMETLILSQARISTELQHRLSDTRLEPFESIVPRLSRIARQVSQELNKQIDFKVLKVEGEMDRTILERLIPSLEHILRNAVDHGIESVETRRARSKPDIGKIEVSFVREGSIAAIEVKDDGGGIDAEAVRKKAIKLGMLSKDSDINDEEVVRYILEPGFSTREAVSEISGRGVGMDVVNTAVKELGGNINISSKPGIGTKITIRFPFTASLNRIMMFLIQGETHGILLTSIDGVFQIDANTLAKNFKEPKPMYKHGTKSYHLFYLGSLLKAENKEIIIPERKSYPLLLFSGSEFPVAFVVDSLLYSRELVVQTLGAQFKLTNECSGATILGDGKVVFILDLYNLTLKAKTMEQEKQTIEFTKATALMREGKALIMVVDDSVSVRAVAKRHLERNQYQVILAKDGIDALQQLEIERPDLILLDLDMPRMDGFELAMNLRKDERFKEIPIIVISSRIGPQFKERAEELKLNGFLKKPYQEEELITLIQSTVGNTNGNSK